VHGHGRPLRDRAIVFLLLSTGLRREELVRLDLAQVAPGTPDALRAVRKAKISGVRGKGRTRRHVYLYLSELSLRRRPSHRPLFDGAGARRATPVGCG
jgi:site-specific recombinase XerD